MAKITVADVAKVNSKCRNGWKVNVQRWVAWGEKVLYKDVELDSGVIIRGTIQYDDICESYKKIGVKPVLKVEKLIPTESGLYIIQNRNTYDYGEVINRRNMKILYNLTEKIQDSEILERVKKLA